MYSTWVVEGTKKSLPLVSVNVTETVPPVLLMAVGSVQLTVTVSALLASNWTSAGHPTIVGGSSGGVGAVKIERLRKKIMISEGNKKYCPVTPVSLRPKSIVESNKLPS